MWIFIFISLTIVIVYSLFIISFYRSWKLAPEYRYSGKSDLEFSVVVAFNKNGQSLLKLLKDLQNQDYPEAKFEVILVNDHDKSSLKLVNKALNCYSDNVRLLSNQGAPGKKHALRYGISRAKYDFILITDSDCRPGPSWIRYFSDYKSRFPHTKLISSGVIMDSGEGFFQAFQALDFSSLVATGASSFLKNRPLMCNAANLGFSRELFLESFDSIYPEVNTGDDMFLMLYTHKKYPHSLGFIKNSDAFTKTSAEGSFINYFRQRKRWGSKAKYYKEPRLVLLSLVVLLVNALILVLILLGFVNLLYPLIAGLLLIFKSVPEYLFLRSFLSFSGQKFSLKFFLPSQFINSFMIPVIAFAGILSGPEKKKLPDERN